ncbi:hypothetical protein PGT21_023920 [Puccinia graminis f. sp. tritici]|uniref:Myb-like domain-containing protein n=1 Tax=Puccinia graminis f. sp. tritici TaxID=56615 RepID=A0A5B0LRF2_PUCGR|nr:hypothetical protein PGT21_023920 [Puccinia graminis f. sp. tritici]
MPPKASSRTHRAPRLTPGKTVPVPTPRRVALPLPSTQAQPSLPTTVTPVTADSTQTSESFSQVPDSQLSATHKKVTCRWTDDDDATLVNCLKDEKALHGGTTNGFKPTSWVQVAKALEGSELINGSKAKDKDTCKSRWQAVSDQFTQLTDSF